MARDVVVRIRVCEVCGEPFETTEECVRCGDCKPDVRTAVEDANYAFNFVDHPTLNDKLRAGFAIMDGGEEQE